jgi:cation diffusion facilitator CzcD-associated flavoprotein CzcO
MATTQAKIGAPARTGAASEANGARPGSERVRVAILGAGFAGLGMAIKLKQAGIDDFVVLERDSDVGGTWWANTYPGCQCDIPSHLYSYSFALNPEWTRTYPKQPEIARYLRGCAERFGIVEHLRLGCEVTGAQWDEDAQRWQIQTSNGELSAEVCIAAPGPLSDPAIPELPGLETFAGETFHTARWRHDVPLTGRRVAVIGTGASAIQAVPTIQPQVARLDVFQRTPPWVVPHRDRPITRLERAVYRRVPALQRLVRSGVYWSRELLVPGLAYRPALMGAVERLARRHLERQVRDPRLRAKLLPSYRIGCKRILPSNHWYPALTKPNVELVTDAIREVRPDGVLTGDGTLHKADVIIFATGFHVTDIQWADRVRGRGGVGLDEVWQGSPQAYRGTTVTGFPNLFLLVGPNTGLGHNSIVFMIEAQLAYVMDALRTMETRGAGALEVRPEVQARYNDRLQRRLRRTVWNSGGCQSWYIDANGRNSTIWPTFTWRYWQQTRRFDAEAYDVAGVRERMAA